MHTEGIYTEGISPAKEVLPLVLRLLIREGRAVSGMQRRVTRNAIAPTPCAMDAPGSRGGRREQAGNA